MTELFGNGRSSSPRNTPKPFDGPRFPVTSIRDNVEAARCLLKEGLGVHHLRAVIASLWGHTAGAGASPADLAFIEAKAKVFFARR